MRRAIPFMAFILTAAVCTTTPEAELTPDTGMRDGPESCLETPNGTIVYDVAGVAFPNTPAVEIADGLLSVSDIRVGPERDGSTGCGHMVELDASLDEVVVGPTVTPDWDRVRLSEALTAIDVPYEFGGSQAARYGTVYALVRGVGALAIRPQQVLPLVALFGVGEGGEVHILGEPIVDTTDYAAIAQVLNATGAYPTMTPAEAVVAWMRAARGDGDIPVHAFEAAYEGLER